MHVSRSASFHLSFHLSPFSLPLLSPSLFRLSPASPHASPHASPPAPPVNALRLYWSREGRQAINTICQGSAADIIKRAMILIDQRLDREAGDIADMAAATVAARSASSFASSSSSSPSASRCPPPGVLPCRRASPSTLPALQPPPARLLLQVDYDSYFDHEDSCAKLHMFTAAVSCRPRSLYFAILRSFLALDSFQTWNFSSFSLLRSSPYDPNGIYPSPPPLFSPRYRSTMNSSTKHPWGRRRSGWRRSSGRRWKAQWLWRRR